MGAWESLITAYRAADIEFPGLKAVSLAQWILESGRGTSKLATEHLNFGGMKYRKEMAGIAEPVTYKAHDGNDRYCKFRSVEDFIKGYWMFIDRSPYRGWRDHAQSGEDYIRFIGAIYTPTAGYADTVLRLVPEAANLLEQGSEEPDRPSRSASGVTIDPPIITYLDHIKHKISGQRPKGLEGLIVHFDAFRIQADSRHTVEERAIQMLVHAEQRGFCYGTIARTGRIFMPGNVGWLDWGSHAGTSRCPVTGRDSVSQYYMGWEINCPGVVYEDEVEGVFFAWFNTKSDANGDPILRNGRRQIRSMQDEHYQPNEVRRCPARDNIKEGWYVPYTREQFDALVSLVRYLQALFPDTFDIDRVLGHDEVAPNRKSDPGGALAYDGTVMTMPAFREYLRQSI
jgi:hypothetical protein